MDDTLWLGAEDKIVDILYTDMYRFYGITLITFFALGFTFKAKKKNNLCSISYLFL